MKNRRYQFRPQIILKAAFVLLLTLGAIQAQEIKNGDFEGGFQPVKVHEPTKAKITGEVGAGWQDESSWAEVEVAYSGDPTGGHGKTAAQKIVVKSIAGGAVQFAQGLKLETGSYHVTAWVRGEGAGRLLLRKAGPPYTTYGSVNVPASSEWTQVEFSGNVADPGVGFLMFIPSELGTYWLDDVTLQAN